MNFTVTEEEGVIIVNVDLPKLRRNKETGLDINRTVLRENHVRDYLKKANIMVKECIKVDNLDNMGDRFTAIWKFRTLHQKKVDKPEAPVVKLDNEVVSAVSSEKTKVASSTPKRRRRKTTTKKAG